MGERHGFRYPDACILVFARAPVYGQVKTRLAAGVGRDSALAVYRQLLEHTLDMVAESCLAPVELHLDGDPEHPFVGRIARRTGATIVAQRDGDLGRRMYLALKGALRQRSSALVIGSDCPVLDAGYLDRALQQLECGTEVVVGPSEDGGYVLIGATRADERVFRGIRWSCDSVMQQTRDALCRADIEFAELETLWDIDHPEDYQRWINLRPVANQLIEKAGNIP